MQAIERRRPRRAIAAGAGENGHGAHAKRHPLPAMDHEPNDPSRGCDARLGYPQIYADGADASDQRGRLTSSLSAEEPTDTSMVERA